MFFPEHPNGGRGKMVNLKQKRVKTKFMFTQFVLIFVWFSCTGGGKSKCMTIT